MPATATATATLFNHHTAPRGAQAGSPPPPVHHIAVVGGGTAGWMTALLLANTRYGRHLQVTVVESPQVGIIGVGEGSTPWLRGFFDSLGIAESDWMPACHATYKCGIRFQDWSTRPGFAAYVHPFASMLDNLTMPQFTRHVHARLDGIDVPAHPDDFFIASRLATEARGPRPVHQFPFDVWYGYHFDSVLLGQYLQQQALARGVRHVPRHIQGVSRTAAGDVGTLHLDGGDTLDADFFVDCSGFAALLLDQTLHLPFTSYADNLFNDAAIAMPTPLADDAGPIPTQTVSTALGHGWAWQIPLTQRYGNGYVYSSAHTTADAAETELRAHLGLLDDPVPARHLKMRVGRVSEHWHRNCVGVGLSQGFIEPLEATALLFVQRTATALVEALEQGDLGPAARGRFNDKLNAQFEGTRDYIVAHYKTNSRTDTAYWRDNAANTALSLPLRELLGTWMARRPLLPGLREGRFGAGYPAFSWYCLLAGMGLFPDADGLRPPQPADHCHEVAEIADLLQRSALNYAPQRALLAAIPPRPTGPTLQAYFW